MTLVIVMSLLALVFGVAPAHAATDRTPVAATLVGSEDISPGDCQVRVNGLVVACETFDWAAPFRTVHMEISNGQARDWWDGSDYLRGETVITYNWMVTVTCGAAAVCPVKGRLWGELTWYPDSYDGGWQCQFAFEISSSEEYGFAYSGNLQGVGFGELEGSRLLLSGVSLGTIAPFGGKTNTGYVLSPGNK